MVRTIAERWILCMLASAQVSLTCFFGIEKHRRKFSSMMRSITKWLVFTLTAGTPVVFFPRFKVNYIRCFLSNFWFHNFKSNIVKMQRYIHLRAIGNSIQKDRGTFR